MAYMLTQVILNGVAIPTTTLMSWSQEETFEQAVRYIEIVVTRSIETLIPAIRPGYTCTVTRGLVTATDQNVFDGYIDRIDKSGATWTIFAKDKMVDLVRANVRYSFDGVAFPTTEAKGSDIAKTLIEQWGGMTATVIDTGTSLTLKKFICNDTDVFSRIQVLCDIYDYQLYYDPTDGTVHFEPKGYIPAIIPIIAGGSFNNVSNVPKWIMDNSQCVNKLIVKGAVQEVDDERFFNGTATALQVFLLPKKPIAVQVWEYVGAVWVLKTPGVSGSTTGAYDYEIDKEEKTIKATAFWSPAIGINNIRVNYSNSIPVPIQVNDPISIGKYGEYQAVKHFSDIVSVDDAERRGLGWLSHYAEPFAITMVKPMRLIDFEAGQVVTITDNHNGETRNMAINKIVKSWPYSGDEVNLGDKEFRLADWGNFTLERIRRLEEELQKNEELLVQLNQFPHTVTLYRRYTIARTTPIVGDGFILGNINQGVLGTDKLGSPFGSAVAQRCVWPNQFYIETFMDIDFKGVGTAVWNTTARRVEL